MWEPVSDAEWEKRYLKDLGPRVESGALDLNLGDLVSRPQPLRQPSQELNRHAAASEVMGELGRWCESVDEFGALLLMATSLEPFACHVIH